MKASILTIGDEILIGQVIDTNSQWIASMLNLEGIVVNEMLSIGDNKEQIIKSLDELLLFSDLIFITGGLGPTNDDITKEVLTEYFKTQLVFNEIVYENMEVYLKKSNTVINKNNYNQALVPASSKIFINKYGTAPGMMFESGDKYVFSLPGVPVEMKYIFEYEIIPFLKKTFIKSRIIHKTLLVVDLPESMLAEKISDWENSLPGYIKLAYLPNYGYIRLRLSVYSADEGRYKIINKKIGELKRIIPQNIIAEEDTSLEKLLGKILKRNDKTVSTAESCTGGKIASMLTSVPGSSAYFEGSIVSYSNSIKTSVLKVNKNDIEKYGAVSQQVVEQMAIRAIKLLGTDYSIATSGIAGPDGGSDEKPVGTVWIAVASKEDVISTEFHFRSNRENNILRAAHMGMIMLIKSLLVLSS